MGRIRNCEHGHRLAEVEASLPGARLTMLSCTACDTRRWLRDGDEIPDSEALAIIADSWSAVRTPRPTAGDVVHRTPTS
jgi:hypothetical protein